MGGTGGKHSMVDHNTMHKAPQTSQLDVDS